MTHTTHCDATTYFEDAPASLRVGSLTLYAEDGASLRAAVRDLPPLYRVTSGGCGETDVVVDNRAEFDDALSASSEWFNGAGTEQSEADDSTFSGSGACATTEQKSSPLGFAPLMLIALGATRSRRDHSR
jgi:MYXO-CTERM domain-containing protein